MLKSVRSVSVTMLGAHCVTSHSISPEESTSNFVWFEKQNPATKSQVFIYNLLPSSLRCCHRSMPISFDFAFILFFCRTSRSSRWWTISPARTKETYRMRSYSMYIYKCVFPRTVRRTIVGIVAAVIIFVVIDAAISNEKKKGRISDFDCSPVKSKIEGWIFTSSQSCANTKQSLFIATI